nr:MAG TPA: hypothetical protein [Caudoviricetes sp.]
MASPGRSCEEPGKWLYIDWEAGLGEVGCRPPVLRRESAGGAASGRPGP